MDSAIFMNLYQVTNNSQTRYLISVPITNDDDEMDAVMFAARNMLGLKNIRSVTQITTIAVLQPTVVIHETGVVQ